MTDETAPPPPAPVAPRPAAIAWALGVARYVLAWALAVVVAALSLFVIGLVLDAVSALAAGRAPSLSVAANDLPWLIAAGAFVAVMTAPAWPVLVLASRLARAPRGFSDVVLGALMGAADLAIFSPQTPKPGMFAVFAVAGGVAGLAFWLVAGRPRPPYRNVLLPG